MKNYLVVNDKRIELTDEQVRKIKEGLECSSKKLSEVPVGEVFKIGGYEFVVLEQCGELTRAILRGLLPDKSTFGNNNNFADEECTVRERLEEFANELECIAGEDILDEHLVDLTSDDGLDDYGRIMVKVSLLTCELYRRYVRILDKYNPKEWWWLVTPYSTSTHEDASWIKCVSPSGYFYYYFYYYYFGVRPFCIFKSNIFVSE